MANHRQAPIDSTAMKLLSDTSNQIFVSTASIWEIGTKVQQGRFNHAPTLLAETVEAGIQILDLKAEHIEQLNLIPFLHKDPFDHILMATAISEQAALLTRDTEILKYQGNAGLQLIAG